MRFLLSSFEHIPSPKSTLAATTLLPTSQGKAVEMVEELFSGIGSLHNGATLMFSDGNSFNVQCGVISVHYDWHNEVVVMWADFHDRRTAFTFRKGKIMIGDQQWVYAELDRNSDLGEMWEWLGYFEIFERGEAQFRLNVHQLDQRYEENLHTNAHEYWTMLREKLL